MTDEEFTTMSLSDDITRALNSLGYDQPTDVQKQVIPLVLTKKDVTVKAQTGSGKTGAFAIPICESVDWDENKPQALVLTPTRELATQVKDEITNIGRFKRVKATAIYGKEPFARQKSELKQKSHVVVGTPGRVFHHIEKGTLSLEKVMFLVIDEADQMLNMGFIDQVEAIIKKIPAERTTMLFSATLPNDVQTLSNQYMKDPVQIEIASTEVISSDIDQSLYELDESEKFLLLKEITVVENPNSCIIFCHTQERVDELYEELTNLDYSCERLHGGMMQKDRFYVMDKFKRGSVRYLVATNVAARGIDVETIALVINFDFPMEAEDYVHRIGRTGRAGEKGKAMSFVTPRDQRILDEVEAYIGFKIKRVEPPTLEEVSNAKPAFLEKMKTRPKQKKDKNEQLNKDIMKLYFNGGKKKKIRAVDFVGTISKLEEVSADDIGIITIQENVSYVDILNGKGPYVLKEMRDTTVKGKQLKVHKANK
ncbi:DEAD/DEAH box helicase [Salipaludibacillus sp. CF4.18]|uniref:DEAD/DEAH box helicase n=1 Tax=Salipaludibacillus sp. CF4.18 TaxID=3373081 RepID=UPI003EE62D25